MNGLLVVDDEEGVRRAVQKALGKENYRCLQPPTATKRS